MLVRKKSINFARNLKYILRTTTTDMKKQLTLFLLALIAVFSFSGCTLTKQMTYFQNMDSVDIQNSPKVPEVRIKQNDQLTIIVSCIDPTASAPFNMSISSGNSSSSTSVDNLRYTYLVDANGEINFPVIGKVKVKGLTRPETEALITEKVKPYFAESETPVVKVTLSSFKVTVIGEVGSPQTITVPNERLTIIEALAQSGDMTVYGKRANILLIRENMEGEKMVARLNMNDARIFNSEYYYLQQNDVIYIEPHKAKGRSADVTANTFWTPISSLAMSVATLILSITR